MILRPRQREFVERCVAALRSHGNTLAVAPTAAGKTVMLSHVARAFRGPGSRGGVVIQHLVNLIGQNSAKFRQCYPESQLGYLTASDKRPVDGPDGWTFGMVQTMQRHLDLLLAWDLIIIDETHHIAADTYGAVIDAVRARNPDVMLLGVSATPNRGDGKGLRKHFDNVADVITFAELIESGHLVPSRSFVRTLVDNADLPMHGDDYDMEAAGEMMIANNARMVEEWEKLCPERKTIVFGCTVAHAASMRDAWAAKGYSSDLVHGGMSETARERALERFTAGETQVMTNCAVLTEGFDDQTVSCICLGRPSSRKTTVIQMIGRGFRTVNPDLHPGIVKTDCYVLDFGTSLRLIGDLEQTVKLEGNEYKTCPECKARVPMSAVECPICGYEFTREEIEPPGPRILAVVDDFAMREIKLIDTSPFRWESLFGERVTMAAGFNAWAALLFHNGLWYCVGGSRFTHAQALAVNPARFFALAAGDDWMREHETEDSAKKSKRWLTEPMSDKQAARLGVIDRMAHLHISKYHATCLLTWAFNEGVVKRIVLHAAQAKADHGRAAQAAASSQRNYAETSLRAMRDG